MIRTLTVSTLALALALPVLAQEGMPEMTPEMKAEMEAYTKAGTPGAPHAMLAKAVGNYDLAIKSWHTPDGPEMAEKEPPSAPWRSTAACWWKT